MKEPRLVPKGGRPRKDAAMLLMIEAATKKGGFEIKGPLTPIEQNKWRKNLAYHTKGAQFTWRFSMRQTEDGGLWVTRKPKKVILGSSQGLGNAGAAR